MQLPVGIIHPRALLDKARSQLATSGLSCPVSWPAGPEFTDSVAQGRAPRCVIHTAHGMMQVQVLPEPQGPTVSFPFVVGPSCRALNGVHTPLGARSNSGYLREVSIHTCLQGRVFESTSIWVLEVPRAMFEVTLCANCPWPVQRTSSSVGWRHWGFWQGVRCQDRLVGAQPGRTLSYGEYLAWLNVRLGGTDE
jgi:hypothetical protein